MELYQQILKEKTLTPDQVRHEFKKLCKTTLKDNKRSFAGNPILYSYMTDELCQTTFKDTTIKNEILTNLAYWETIAEKVNRTGTHPIRVFEAIRFARFPIAFFKPTTAKHIYDTLGSKKVLDPTAGWGGRLLGAMASGCEYTGYDTNLNLRPLYKKMMEALNTKHSETDTEDTWLYNNKVYKMRWVSCETIYEESEYDTVLTSPPYMNLELYREMTPFQSKEKFYTEFLTPLPDACLTALKPGGSMCINISPVMYQELLTIGKYEKADHDFEMLQQKRLGKDKKDKTYVWKA